MAVLDDLGDDLAQQCLKAMAEMGDDRFYNDVAKVLGTSSPSLQEAFLTSMRLRLAAARGKKFIDDTMKARRDGSKAPAAPRDIEPLGGH